MPLPVSPYQTMQAYTFMNAMVSKPSGFIRVSVSKTDPGMMSAGGAGHCNYGMIIRSHHARFLIIGRLSGQRKIPTRRPFVG